MDIYTTEKLRSMDIQQVEEYYKKLHSEHSESIIQD